MAGSAGTNTVVEPNSQPAYILGRRVIETTSDEHIGAKHIVTHSWLAPDLDCFKLKETSTVFFSLNGSELSARIESEALEIKPGEPDPRMFNIPVGYTERAPLQILAEASKRKGEASCARCLDAAVPIMDQAYHKRRGE